ncbi:hypothetical protein CRYUN_Cryun02cG0134400 [Craigia yunnanensis]
MVLVVEVEYKPLPCGPHSDCPKDNTDKEVTVWKDVRWKELGLLCFVWIAFLVLQIAKVIFFFFVYESNSYFFSSVYWVLNILQESFLFSRSLFRLGVALYEAVSLYEGRRVIASKGDQGTN